MPSDRPDQPAALPAGLDLLWGRREAGQRGPRRGRSVDDIVASAVALADREGLEAVSMARVAGELGLTTMSLYRYVANKDELLQLMWNASAVEAETFELEGDDWRSRLRSWIEVQRATIDRHPWITQMPMAAPPTAPNSLLFVEKGLEALDDTELADADKLRVIGLLSSYSLSEARMADDAARAARRAAEAGEQLWSFDALLRELVDQDTYPRLHRIAWQEQESAPSELEEFRFGVERILDGVQVLVETGKVTRSRRGARKRPASEST
jgi:AcrR family transcriptional regulator